MEVLKVLNSAIKIINCNLDIDVLVVQEAVGKSIVTERMRARARGRAARILKPFRSYYFIKRNR